MSDESMNGLHRLEVDYYDDGRPRVAYLYLGKRDEAKSASSREITPGFVIDLAADGLLIGIEILDPDRVSLKTVNSILARFGEAPLTPADLSPLKVA